MKYKIQPNDIPLLAKIFDPATDLVYVLTSLDTIDFYQKITDKLDCSIHFFTEETSLQKQLVAAQQSNIVLVNLTHKSALTSLINKFPTLIIIDFSTKKLTPTDFVFEFNFINNRDNSIRWIYGTNYQRPIFLNLYNASGWKGQLFKTIFKIGFSLKLKKWLKSGSFQVIANQLFLEKINQQLNHAQYAIFTGTVGANRKAVISYEEGEKATQFLKMPLTKKVQKLVDREAFYLTELQNYSFEKLVVPVAKKIENSVMVSNVKPANILTNNSLSKTHLLALNELYQQTTTNEFLQSTEMWQAIHQDLSTIATANIVNDLSKEKAKNIHRNLTILAIQFEEIAVLPMSIAHGDLTPWNSYLSTDKLHVYDWELAERLPLLYDAFHYIFQTSILVERLPYTAVKLKIENLKKDPIIQSILAAFDITFQQAYHFYLLRNTSYYLRHYIQQQNLHIQAHWLVDMWEIALKDACTHIRVLN